MTILLRTVHGSERDRTASIVKHECWKWNGPERYRKTAYKVREEVAIEGGSVDLVPPGGKELIAIEVETGKSDAIRNIRKDLKAGFDRIVVGEGPSTQIHDRRLTQS